jgi:hypothetical protein
VLPSGGENVQPTKIDGREREKINKYFLVIQKFMRESCRAVLARLLLALFFIFKDLTATATRVNSPTSHRVRSSYLK